MPGINESLPSRFDNARRAALVKAIPGVPGITGLEYVPGLATLYRGTLTETAF